MMKHIASVAYVVVHDINEHLSTARTLHRSRIGLLQEGTALRHLAVATPGFDFVR